MSSARLLMRMAYICSNCETALRLKIADKIPTHFPYCGTEFVHDGEHGRVFNEHEETVTSLKTPLSSNG